jgi:hypothetical protein
MTFKLQSFPEYFAATLSGAKTHELRATVDVPGVAVGDVFQLQEYDPIANSYTGRTALVGVTYISPAPKPWLVPGYLLISTSLLERTWGQSLFG